MARSQLITVLSTLYCINFSYVFFNIIFFTFTNKIALYHFPCWHSWVVARAQRLQGTHSRTFGCPSAVGWPWRAAGTCVAMSASAATGLGCTFVAVSLLAASASYSKQNQPAKKSCFCKFNDRKLHKTNLYP